MLPRRIVNHQSPITNESTITDQQINNIVVPRDQHPPRIGISRCLLGDEVRYDGGHKRDPFLVSTFGRFVEWVPVCPEVEIGMGTPREPIQLVASNDGVSSDGQSVRLVGVKSRQDWTMPMTTFAASRVRELKAADLAGYVLKKDSPSCGLERVRVHNPFDSLRSLRAGPFDSLRSLRASATRVTRSGRGLFAEALVRELPNLPIEEEGRLNDPALRENFVERVFAYQRLRTLFAGRWAIHQLVVFHSMHKLQLLSHSRQGYAELGRLVASAVKQPRRDLSATYQRLFMTTLSRLATLGRHSDVMMHAIGHLKRLIQADDRDELLAAIADHRRGIVPLIVPITLLRHHIRRHDVGYLKDQTYLDPHPRELALRNHV
jgi:uncharacterized protein YbgA (DUF1722 family)/uncharacterized protein YbbK (DUF523 family)